MTCHPSSFKEITSYLLLSNTLYFANLLHKFICSDFVRLVWRNFRLSGIGKRTRPSVLFLG
jgi:hypothetical protein